MYRNILTLSCLLCTLATAVPALAGSASARATGDDARLRALAERLLAEHPRLAAARAEVEAARARERAAGRPLYNPELEIDAERTSVDTTSIGINQTIDLGNKRAARRDAAAARLAARLAALAVERNALLADFLRALAAWRTAANLNDLAAERARLMARFQELAEQRFRAGDINQVELDLARQATIQAALSRAVVRGDLEAAHQRLEAFMPNMRGAWPRLPEHLPALDSVNVEALLPGLPGLRRVRAELEALRGELELSRRQRTIDPTIGLRAGREGDDDLFGVNLAIPLHLRNTYRAEVEAAGADLLAAEAALRDTRRRLLSELNSAAERYRLIRQAWTQWQAFGAPSLSRQTQALERLWQAGELGATEYLVQLDQTLETRAEAIRTRGELWQRWFDWLEVSARLDQWLGLEGSGAETNTENVR